MKERREEDHFELLPSPTMKGRRSGEGRAEEKEKERWPLKVEKFVALLTMLWKLWERERETGKKLRLVVLLLVLLEGKCDQQRRD